MNKLLIAIGLSLCLTSTAMASTIVRHERTVNNPDTRIETDIDRPTPFTQPAEETTAEPAVPEEKPAENPPPEQPATPSAEKPSEQDSNTNPDHNTGEPPQQDNVNAASEPATNTTPAPDPQVTPPQPEIIVPPATQPAPLKNPDYAVSTVDKFLGKDKPDTNPFTRQGSNKTYNYSDSIFIYGDEPNSEDYVIALRTQIHKENPAVKYHFLIIMLGRGQDKDATLDNTTLPVLIFTNGENEKQKPFSSAWIRNKQSLMLRIDPDLRDKILETEKLTLSLNTNEGQKNIPLPDSVCQQWKNLLGTVTK